MQGVNIYKFVIGKFGYTKRMKIVTPTKSLCSVVWRGGREQNGTRKEGKIRRDQSGPKEKREMLRERQGGRGGADILTIICLILACCS